jgi:hypothetical protein
LAERGYGINGQARLNRPDPEEVFIQLSFRVQREEEVRHQNERKEEESKKLSSPSFLVLVQRHGFQEFPLGAGHEPFTIFGDS